MLLAAIVSFLVAWAFGFSAQQEIRRYLPFDIRDDLPYGVWVDQFAFADATPGFLRKRYLLSHSLFVIPSIFMLALCAMIANRNAEYFCMFFIFAAIFNFVRSWRRFSIAEKQRRQNKTGRF